LLPVSYLNKLNQSILAKAFRGELVPQDPNDEPASVLLERIRAEREKLNTKKKAKGKTEKKSRKPKPEPAEPELSFSGDGCINQKKCSATSPQRLQCEEA
jgi:type I restriction enzyme S subunit